MGKKKVCNILGQGLWFGSVCLISSFLFAKVEATDELLTPVIEAGRGPVLDELMVSSASVKPPEHKGTVNNILGDLSDNALETHYNGRQERTPIVKEGMGVKTPQAFKGFNEDRLSLKLLQSLKDEPNFKSSQLGMQPRSKETIKRRTREGHTLSDVPKLDRALRAQLLILNRVLAERSVRDLLRFFPPDVRLDAPSRPGVWGRGADLVFALQTLFESKGHYSLIPEEVIPLRRLRLKGQNDRAKDCFLLTRNAFPLTDDKGLVRGGKAVVLWQLAPGLGQPRASGMNGKGDGSADGGKNDGPLERERTAFAGKVNNDATSENQTGYGPMDETGTDGSAENEGDGPKWQLLIRWWIWNFDGDSRTLTVPKVRSSPREVGRLSRKHREERQLSDTSVKALNRTLHDRWRTFSQTLTRGDVPGCLDFISPDTVAMPPGNPSVRGSELRQLCEAFVQAGVTQQVEINEALLFKGRRILRRGRHSSYSKIKYFVLENDAFKNSYAESNSTETGKQVIFWELHPGNKSSITSPNDIPLHKSTLKWGWTIWNGDESDIT